MHRLGKYARLKLFGAIAAVVMLLAGIGYLAGGCLVYYRLTRVDAHCGGNYAQNTPASFTSDQLDTTPYLMPTYEDVSFSSRGDPGVKISGWWVPGVSADAPAVIEVHGLGSCKHSPTVLLPAGMLHRRGYNVLLIDLRNQGDSDITTGRCAGGVIEHKDVLGAWDWVRSTYGIPASHIGLAGMSLGAATALIATGQEPGVAAVWEDSGYGDISVAISGELARNGYPTFLSPAAILAGRAMGLDITAMGPLDSVRKLNGRPIAIIHGTADTRIPIKHAETLRQAVEDQGGHPYVWFVDGAEHTQAVFKHPVEYETRLAAFFGPAIGAAGTGVTQGRLAAFFGPAIGAAGTATPVSDRPAA